MHRALPDARDGLKPVHRRILYGMRLLRLDPGAAFKKSAKIVGDVMGNFHPHGDQAIYDALVRLAQDFASRYPLIDGQGNFGNIDGDNAAAYRYTEARMTEVARLLIEGIDEDAVDFRPNYDGLSEEPVVLPGAFPNLLANGSQGIAVGMATSIPPHNAAELCDAALYLITHKRTSSKALMQFVPGPDFPTGGIVVDDKAAIAEAYATGRGSFRVRARWHKEDQGRGVYSIVITEIPYLVQKSRLIEKIAELLNDRKLPLVADVRDELTEDVRLIIEPKSRAVDATLLMESLFKLTELESRVPLNMNVLVKGRVPTVVGLAEALREWLDHRRDVLVRRSKHRLAAIDHRLEVLGGLLVAYLNLDKVIKIIRTQDEPKPVLMKTFKITDVQADAILNMRLRNLRKLEEMEIRTEDKELRDERKKLKALLGSEADQWKTISAEIKEIRELFGPKTKLGKRRTSFGEAPEHDAAAIEEALVEREPVTVVVSEKGWIRALRGHVSDLSGGHLQDRRRAEIRVPGRDDVALPVVRDQRPLLHARCSEAPGRTRAWRAVAALHRHGAGHRCRFGVPASGRPQIPGRKRAGPRLCRRGRRLRRQYPQGQAGPQREAERRRGRHRERRGRSGRRDRREPEDGDLPDRRCAGNGPRIGRAAAALQGRRLVGRDDLRRQGRPDLARWRGPGLHDDAQGIVRLARQARRCRPSGAQGIPEIQQFRPQDITLSR